MSLAKEYIKCLCESAGLGSSFPIEASYGIPLLHIVRGL